jgi:hypothetical protein
MAARDDRLVSEETAPPRADSKTIQEQPLSEGNLVTSGGLEDIKETMMASEEKDTNIKQGAVVSKGSPTGFSKNIATNEERAFLENEIERKRNSYNRQSVIWGILYHTSMYISAILSLAAALALKLDSLQDWPFQKDFSAIAAGFAGIIIILTVAGGFHRKWRVSRASRSNIEQLAIDFSRHDANIYDISNRLKEILSKHEERIVGPEK